jgi:hypothetical protein
MSDDDDMRDGDDFGQDFRFRVRVLIRHDSIPAQSITAALGVEPDGCESVGEPTGFINSKGIENIAIWTAWSVSRDFEGLRQFFPPGLAVLNSVVGANDAYVRGLTETGGSVTLIFDLPGDVNLGSEMDPAGLARLADLKVDLGIEIFPDSPPGTRGRARAEPDG